MRTRCTECQTTFLITEQQLNAAGGKARCGKCGSVFDARAALLPDPDADSSPRTEPDSVELATAAAPGTPTAPPAEEQTPVSEPDTNVRPQPAQEPIPAVLLEDFEQVNKRGARRHGSAWGIAIIVLALCLALQYVYFKRVQLVNQFPKSRPWLVDMCGVLSAAIPCDVPYARNLAELRMLSSEVSEHPDTRSALLIQATFVNTAKFTQPFPILEVKLSDLRGQTVALRRFRPAEYLRGNINTGQGMVPRAPVTALIEVTRPFVDVNSYSFAFY